MFNHDKYKNINLYDLAHLYKFLIESKLILQSKELGGQRLKIITSKNNEKICYISPIHNIFLNFLYNCIFGNGLIFQSFWIFNHPLNIINIIIKMTIILLFLYQNEKRKLIICIKILRYTIFFFHIMLIEIVSLLILLYQKFPISLYPWI